MGYFDEPLNKNAANNPPGGFPNLPSLKLTASQFAPLKIGKGRQKETNSSSNYPFSDVNSLIVSGSVSSCFFLKTILPPGRTWPLEASFVWRKGTGVRCLGEKPEWHHHLGDPGSHNYHGNLIFRGYVSYNPYF